MSRSVLHKADREIALVSLHRGYFLLFLEANMITPTSINEQLDILSKRNIILNENSRQILLQYGYYNLINGYKDAFVDPVESKKRNQDFYQSGTTLDDIVTLYQFDADLRRYILTCVTIIETQMKSLLSLYFSAKFGSNHWDYLRPDSFSGKTNQRYYVNRLLKRLKDDIDRYSTKKPHPAICHFVNEYGQVPLWVLNTVMSFGTMANFYDLLQDDMKKNIAHAISTQLKPKTLTSILYYLTDIRNKCAHNNRLYTHKQDQRSTRVATIPYLDIHKKLNIPISAPGRTYCHGQDDILAALICIAVFFRQTRVYEVNYESIESSLSSLSEHISPSVESYVRDVTGLKSEYIKGLEQLQI